MSSLFPPYAFQPHEEPRHGFMRVLGEIADRAQILTTRSCEPRVELIHQGRLLFKRLRALLWYGRPALSHAAYTRVRTRLRHAAGLLSDLRDLAVARETLEELGRKSHARARHQAAIAHVLRVLPDHSTAGRKEQIAMRRTLKKAMMMLRQSVSEIKRSAVKGNAWPNPAKRVEKAFLAMRQAEKEAGRTEGDADFHTWRKKAKTFLYLLELTHSKPNCRMASFMSRVGKLQSALGDYHDDVVVEERLRHMTPRTSPARHVILLLARRKTASRKKLGKLAQGIDAFFKSAQG